MYVIMFNNYKIQTCSTPLIVIDNKFTVCVYVIDLFHVSLWVGSSTIDLDLYMSSTV